MSYLYEFFSTSKSLLRVAPRVFQRIYFVPFSGTKSGIFETRHLFYSFIIYEKCLYSKRIAVQAGRVVGPEIFLERKYVQKEKRNEILVRFYTILASPPPPENPIFQEVWQNFCSDFFFFAHFSFYKINAFLNILLHSKN